MLLSLLALSLAHLIGNCLIVEADVLDLDSRIVLVQTTLGSSSCNLYTKLTIVVMKAGYLLALDHRLASHAPSSGSIQVPAPLRLLIEYRWISGSKDPILKR